MNAYLYMTKIKLLLALNYKYEFFVNFFVKIILLLASSFFWKAAFNGVDTVASVDENQMLIYSVMSIVLGCIFTVTIDSIMRSRVRMGSVAVDFIKPVNVFLMYFSEDVGNMITEIIQSAIPVLIFSSIFVVIPNPTSILHFILFLMSTLLSFSILWLISAIFGLLYFRFIDLGPLSNIKNYLILLLSGSFVPIWFFPKIMQDILIYLPFIYTYQLPLSIYIGRSDVFDALKGMIIQFIWVLIFLLFFIRMKKRIEKNIFVQGG